MRAHKDQRSCWESSEGSARSAVKDIDLAGRDSENLRQALKEVSRKSN